MRYELNVDPQTYEHRLYTLAGWWTMPESSLTPLEVTLGRLL